MNETATTWALTLEPVWYPISVIVVSASQIVLLLPLVGFHALRTWQIWRLGRPCTDWLTQFHFLSLVALVSFVPYCAWRIFCINPINCTTESLHPAALYTVVAFDNLGLFCLNALVVLLGYVTRKEIVYAKHGPSPRKESQLRSSPSSKPLATPLKQ